MDTKENRPNVEKLLKEIEVEFGSFTGGLAERQTGSPIRIFHGISMTADDWYAFKEKWLSERK